MQVAGMKLAKAKAYSLRTRRGTKEGTHANVTALVPEQCR
jgi:hypothetical protein